MRELRQALDALISGALVRVGGMPGADRRGGGAPQEVPDVLDLLRSMFRFSWAMSLFGARQVRELMAPAEPSGSQAPQGFDEVTRAARDQMDGTVRRLFDCGERWQRGGLDAALGTAGAGPAAAALPVDRGSLDVTTFVVLGEGLAAGLGDFGLSEELQRESFPAQMARQMGTDLAQPLFEAPGIGHPAGFPSLPVRIPGLGQTTVFAAGDGGPSLGNLSIPGLGLADALERRPVEPVVDRHDALQTAINLVLGMPGFRSGREDPLPTQLEAAVERRPTFALVELGFAEVLEAAVAGRPSSLRAPEAWRADYARLFTALRQAGAQVLALTVPDPTDTAAFSPVEVAARVVRSEPEALRRAYQLQPEDRITVSGLVEIGGQILASRIAPLSAGSVLPGAAAGEIRARVEGINAALREAAGSAGVTVHDLHALIRRVREQGVSVGGRLFTADLLGGFYSLNGHSPGRTGHALIADDILRHLNQVYGAGFRSIPAGQVMLEDTVASYQPAGGRRLWTDLSLLNPPPPPPQAPVVGPAAPARAAGPGDGRRLRLPDGLEQVLPLSKAASYHGDAIRIVSCRDARDIQWGSCAGQYFGGLVMYDSHLAGAIRIRFTPPAGDVTRFQVTHEGGLAGDDGILAAPQFFRWPVLQARVLDDQAVLSTGTLNLATGEVSDLQYVVRYMNTALMALAGANPGLNQPIAFPGQYGSAWARFDPRPDGRLDFTFYGSTFLPLGGALQGTPVRWALPFVGPELQFASMPAPGMVMHPHLHLSTREPEGPDVPQARIPDLPFNTVQELVLFARNSSLGDQFTLHTPELGGTAKGRSHLAGRLQVQFGERFGDSVSVSIAGLPPGGLLRPQPASPVVAEFPGRITPGPLGHNEFLRFPLRSYFLDVVEILDDPFDISVGAVDLRTGRFLTELLHRGLINQDLFFALVRVEPRTPKSSFFFRGPARFEKGPNGQLVFRHKSEVRVPYPEGFFFPAPDLSTGVAIGPGSHLDPFLWLQAMHDPRTGFIARSGAGREVRASTGEIFSYRYSLPREPRREMALFEYTNHSQGGTFRMYTLLWVSFMSSRNARPRKGEADTVTLAGYGTWSRDGGVTPHLVTAQFADTPEVPYVSIQIDGGLVSNVNTKPEKEDDALP